MANLIKEIATRARSIDHWSLGYYLPNPDPILKKMGKDISVYKELLSDPHLSGCVRRRKAAVKGLHWRLTPTGQTKIDDMLQQMFERLPISDIINEMMTAMLFGYQVLEILWEQKDGYIVPKAVIGKPQEWFVFDEDNALRFRTKQDWFVGELLPQRKFLLVRQEASYTNPYGMGDLSKCFWAATFKKGGLKFWLEFIEKYGSPWLIGKHHRSASSQETSELADSLEAMIGTAVAVIPDDSSIEILEAGGKTASSEVFDQFLKYCKAEIAIAILGQNQTTEAEANRASSQAGLEVIKDLRDDDVAMVSSAFNQLLVWICELNFKTDTLPKFELYEQESIDKLQAERDVMLTQMGVVFHEQYVKRTYNFQDGDFGLSNDTPAEFGETIKPKTKVRHRTNAKERVEPLIDKLGQNLQSVKDKQLAMLKKELDSATSLTDFQDRLDNMADKLDFAEYAKLFADGMALAHLTGRDSVLAERRDD